MKFSDILPVNPDPDFYSGQPSPRKLLLEGGRIIPNEEYTSDEEDIETRFEDEDDTDTFPQNAYDTFIATDSHIGNGYFFPRR